MNRTLLWTIVTRLRSLVGSRRSGQSLADTCAYTVYLTDGRPKAFAEVRELDHLDGKWIRCTRPETSPRANLPETTKYYHDSEVVRISSAG